MDEPTNPEDVAAERSRALVEGFQRSAGIGRHTEDHNSESGDEAEEPVPDTSEGDTA